MDTFRVWPPFFVILLIVSGFFVFNYFEKVDRANESLQTSRLYFQQSKQSLDARKQTIATREFALAQSHLPAAQLHAAEARLAASAEKQLKADSNQQIIEGELRNQIASMKLTSQRVQNDLLKSDFPELMLSSGRLLKNVRLRKNDSGTFSFTHSEGLGSCSLDELPRELVEKMDLGPRSILKRLQDLQTGTDPSVKVHVTETVEVNPRLLALKRRASNLESQIASAYSLKEKREIEVRQYDQRVISEEGLGRSAFNLRTMRDVAEGNAGLARTELNFLEAELKKIRAEENALMNSQR